jgi:hypothetical protein
LALHYVLCSPFLSWVWLLAPTFFLSFWLSVLIMSCCSLLRIPAAQLGNSWDDDEEIQDLSLQLLMTINLQISWQAGN